MATRDIRPSTVHTICDVCGRTLLRGERAEAYLQGSDRRWVCELCKSRAIHEGWVPEGTMPAYSQSTGGSERRRSLLSRLRGRREALAANGDGHRERDELAAPAWSEPAVAHVEPPRTRGPVREPRHVRAVPTSAEHKIATAIELFNGSEHTRTVSGVGRSLGMPIVVVSPSNGRPSLVDVVVSWELCWYRYEVDLSDDVPDVRVTGQGYELDELTSEERQANAAADENGMLSLGRLTVE